MLVSLILISSLLCHVRGLGRVLFSLSSFSPVLIDLCGRGGVREHPSARTRTGETEPARHPPPEMVQVSVDRGGAVRPPWTPRNRPRAAFAADARSLPPIVVTRPAGPISRGGSAPQ